MCHYSSASRPGRCGFGSDRVEDAADEAVSGVYNDLASLPVKAAAGMDVLSHRYARVIVVTSHERRLLDVLEPGPERD